MLSAVSLREIYVAKSIDFSGNGLPKSITSLEIILSHFQLKIKIFRPTGEKLPFLFTLLFSL